MVSRPSRRAGALSRGTQQFVSPGCWPDLLVRIDLRAGRGRPPSAAPAAPRSPACPARPGPAVSMTRRARSADVTSCGRGAPGCGGRRSKSGGIVSGARNSTANSSGPTRSMPSATRKSRAARQQQKRRDEATASRGNRCGPATTRSFSVMAKHLPPDLLAAHRAATACRPATSPPPQDKWRCPQD